MEKTDIAPPSSARFPAAWYPTSGLPGYTLDIERDAPYTATLVTRGTALDPRTHQYKTLTNTTLQARDSAGRKHEEVDMPRPDGHGGTVDTHQVTVHDPVSHCDFRWIQPWAAPGKPTATATCMPRVLHYHEQNIWAEALVTAPEDKVEDPMTFHSEPLGKRSFGNIPAEGVRQTKKIVKSSTGKTSTVITEIWYSPELKELLSMKMDFLPAEPLIRLPASN